ncbi:hypothetical protein GCM10029992_42700 [Glycomyces albus]
MIFEIVFERGTSADLLRDALVERFGIPSERVFIGSNTELDRRLREGMRFPIAVIGGEPRSGEFSQSFESHDQLIEAVGGLSVVALGTVLCKATGARALVGDGGYVSECFILITPDGWHGRVMLAEEMLDEPVFDLDYALQPVPSDPSIPVVEEPHQKGWYPDGEVPEAGYAFPEDEPEAPSAHDGRE